MGPTFLKLISIRMQVSQLFLENNNIIIIIFVLVSVTVCGSDFVNMFTLPNVWKLDSKLLATKNKQIQLYYYPGDMSLVYQYLFKEIACLHACSLTI